MPQGRNPLGVGSSHTHPSSNPALAGLTPRASRADRSDFGVMPAAPAALVITSSAGIAPCRHRLRNSIASSLAVLASSSSAWAANASSADILTGSLPREFGT